MESPEVFIFGHASRPDRNRYPSAHNYYLDLVYNFGLISLLPFMYLVYLSIKSVGYAVVNSSDRPSLIMLVVLMFFFIFIDNFLKVGFSQPYPGMMMFFFWGILFARVSVFRSLSSGESRLRYE